ncbi:MAG: hypothetical protein P8Y10_01020 [Gemmatimonadales bacterium]
MSVLSSRQGATPESILRGQFGGGAAPEAPASVLQSEVEGEGDAAAAQGAASGGSEDASGDGGGAGSEEDPGG